MSKRAASNRSGSSATRHTPLVAPMDRAARPAAAARNPPAHAAIVRQGARGLAQEAHDAIARAAVARAQPAAQQQPRAVHEGQQRMQTTHQPDVQPD